ncbi:MAG: nucleotidyltransferase domain-containing protein [Candidatus Sumerlaeales bacterium]|nr:nucleotidyltransferase domain-containing protein [Candidatus Sumerlaeales bacterium]
MKPWIISWMERFIAVVRDAFEDRVICIGLQGSYGRDEATESSDIDVVVILDKVTIEDLRYYQKLIAPLPERSRVCGFVSGKEELISWEKSDLFQFYHDTRVMYGTLNFLNHIISPSDAKRAVLIGACNIYHACVHNVVHENDLGILRSLFKNAYFVLQAKNFCDNDNYCKNKIELRKALSQSDRSIIDALSPTVDNFDSLSEELLQWAGNIIKSYSI